MKLEPRSLHSDLILFQQTFSEQSGSLLRNTIQLEINLIKSELLEMVIILWSCKAIRPRDENAQSETRLKIWIDCASWDEENMTV